MFNAQFSILIVHGRKESLILVVRMYLVFIDKFKQYSICPSKTILPSIFATTCFKMCVNHVVLFHQFAGAFKNIRV